MHELQDRHAKLVLAKIRQDCVLKDGVVFNNDYEGSPAAGAIKIPVRDEEVKVSDYDRANGIQASSSSTGYETILIDRDKAVNEVIDGYEASAVPDNIKADRLDSAGYALAVAQDTDGGNALLAGSTKMGVEQITKDNVYSIIVDVRKQMNIDKIPKKNRYLLVTPDAEAEILKADEFIAASSLGDEVKQTGALGMIAGFLVIPWTDTTPNLQMIAGHPRFATRACEFSVPPKIVNLDSSDKYVGASAIKGRYVYAHKVLRSIAIKAVYAPTLVIVDCAPGATAKTTIATVTGAEGTLHYRINPSVRAKYGQEITEAFTALESGVTEIKANQDAVIEVVVVGEDNTVIAAGYGHAQIK